MPVCTAVISLALLGTRATQPTLPTGPTSPTTVLHVEFYLHREKELNCLTFLDIRGHSVKRLALSELLQVCTGLKNDL